MGKWSDEVAGGGNYLSTKIGEEATFEIIAINRITNKPDYEPKTKDGTRQGFLFEFVSADGILTVGTYVLQAALRDADVDVGNTVCVKHLDHGKYQVTKIK